MEKKNDRERNKIRKSKIKKHFPFYEWQRQMKNLEVVKDRGDKIAEQEIRHSREKCWSLKVPADEHSCCVVNFWFKDQKCPIYYR